MDLLNIILKNMPKEDNSDPYSLIGEPDDKGNIVFVRHYLNDPKRKRKSKPIIIPASQFWGTAQAVKDGTYTPRKVTNSIVNQLALVPFKKRNKTKTVKVKKK